VLQIGYVLIGINKFVIENKLLENYQDELIHLKNINLDYNFDYEEIENESEQIINQNEIISRQQENQNSFLNFLLQNISSDEEDYNQILDGNNRDDFQNNQNNSDNESESNGENNNNQTSHENQETNEGSNELSNNNLFTTPKRIRRKLTRYSPSKVDLIEKSNRLKRKLELEKIKSNKKKKN
jgi:hypothetical protein